MGRAVNEFKFPTQYLKENFLFPKMESPQI